ncbi:MAG: response regulator transcription factor [Balneolaceae bacterium]
MTLQGTHTIWIVEDDLFFKESLEYLIEGAPDMELGLSVSSVEETRRIGSNITTPDIILHDIGLPGISGLEAIGLHKERFPEVLIIMLTIFEDDERIFKAIKNGADGYLLKRTEGEKIIEGIRDALKGGAPMSPGIAKKVMEMLAHGGPKKETNLTRRELEVLELLVNGYTMDMVSAKLEISSGTVDSHIKHIYKKLQVHNRAEVVSKAIKDRLI